MCRERESRRDWRLDVDFMIDRVGSSAETRSHIFPAIWRALLISSRNAVSQSRFTLNTFVEESRKTHASWERFSALETIFVKFLDLNDRNDECVTLVLYNFHCSRVQNLTISMNLVSPNCDNNLVAMFVIEICAIPRDQL